MKWVVDFFSLMLVSSAVFASDLPPQHFRDERSKPIQVSRTFSTQSPTGTGLPYSISCHAKLVDSFFGYLDDEQFFSRKMPFNLVCYPETDEQTAFPVVRFDKEKNKWVKDATAWEKEADESTDLDHRKHLQKLIKTTVVYDIQAVNSQGWAMTQEDLIGDESIRRRMLHYCLIHSPKALCGEGEVGYLKDGRKGDLTDYALKILRSIEFLEDEPPAPEATAPATQPQDMPSASPSK
jgi:hypothetical protein